MAWSESSEAEVYWVTASLRAQDEYSSSVALLKSDKDAHCSSTVLSCELVWSTPTALVA